ncbi:MAG TPA: YciI family protein [Solirubrobacteraceae bacterium]|nr:YciI family protein [Solirubrobacteraceae bacterium]
MATHTILFYDYVDDVLERRGPHRPGHLAHIDAEKGAGRLLMAGALGDPPHGGAFVFRPGVEPTHIEQFVQADPYFRAGLVTAWRTEPWNLV